MEEADSFLQRIQAARSELQQIRDLNVQLETQCQLQKKVTIYFLLDFIDVVQELDALRDQRVETQEELKKMVSGVEALMKDKITLETKLNEIRMEGQKLVSFVSQSLISLM